MTREEIVKELEAQQMTEIIELIEDAEAGELEQLELARALGLLRDEDLNNKVISYLKENGVEIIYLDE